MIGNITKKDLVIKYFNNKKTVSKRVKRAKLLKGYVPDIYMYNHNFFAYKKMPGLTLSEVIDNSLFNNLS